MCVISLHIYTEHVCDEYRVGSILGTIHMALCRDIHTHVMGVTQQNGSSHEEHSSSNSWSFAVPHCRELNTIHC